MSEKTKDKTVPPTVITLTIPTPVDGDVPIEQTTATLLIQRGDLAHVRQFQYVLLADLTTAIQEASHALALLEDNPPKVPPAPQKTKSKSEKKSKTSKSEVEDSEPTIDIPLKKGTKTIPMSYLKIVAGETDASAYRQAVLLAGRLIDGKLWDGESAIQFKDVYAVAKHMKQLKDNDLTLFSLEDFAQCAN